MKKPTTDRSTKHVKLMAALKAAPEPLTIRDLTRKAFPGVRPIEKGDSQEVRNTLRALVAEKLVKKVGRGMYRAVARS